NHRLALHQAFRRRGRQLWASATPSALKIASSTCSGSDPSIRRTCRVRPAPSASSRRKVPTTSWASPATRASLRSTFETTSGRPDASTATCASASSAGTTAEPWPRDPPERRASSSARPAARSLIGDDGLGDRQRRRLDSERTQEELEELAELDRHELALANRLLPSQPQHPVPEVPVDSLEGLRPQSPGQLLRVRLVRKDQVDLHGAGKEQHPAVLLGEAVPLLEQRLERREQLRQRR